jgi:predicted metal-dependent HD superfamily phosphohydrolase
MNQAITLFDRWQRVWRRLGATEVDEGLFHQLGTSYSEPHRKYHTMQHLDECFGHLERLAPFSERPAEVELALWFHDAIYHTRKKDNEKRSAKWAMDSILAAGLATDLADRVHELIMATVHNAVPKGKDAGVLVDIDLAILGAEQERFNEFEVQVREEYSWVPGFLFRPARRQILEEFARREKIYSTELFRAEREAQARKNIARSLARLQG